MKKVATTFAAYSKATKAAENKPGAATYREKAASKGVLRKLGSKFPEENADIYKEDLVQGSGPGTAATWKKACLKAVPADAVGRAAAAESAFHKYGLKASRQRTADWRTWARQAADSGGADAHRATKL